MAKKSPKKLTPNQAEWNKLRKNAKATYNRRLKEGYESLVSFEEIIPKGRPQRITKKMLGDIREQAKSINDQFYAISEQGEMIMYTSIPRVARGELKSTGFTRYQETTATGVHLNVVISKIAGMNHDVYIPGAEGNYYNVPINTADLAFSNFMDTNRQWVTSTSEAYGFNYIVDALKEERHNLQTLYGTGKGDVVFALMLQAISGPDSEVQYEEAKRVSAAQRWLNGFYSVRQSSVQEMMELSELYEG